MEYVQLEGIHIHEDGYAKFIELTLINLFATKLANNPQTAPLHPLRFPKKLYLCKQRLITETEWLKSLFIKPTEFEGFRMEVLDTGVVGRPLQL